MSFKKKTAGTMILALAMTSTLAACGGGKEGGSAAPGGGQAAPAADAGKPEAPLELSVMVHFLQPQPASDDNPVKRAIEKATNTKLNIQWVSGNNYTDKLNVTLASGDMPDLVFINDPFSPVFRNMAAQGAFWDVGPYIKDYPNLVNGISKTAWDLSKMADGKNYGIPRPRPSEADSFFILRKDWLDAVGMKMPTTTDELYQVMKAFTEKDPDKNGKNDTFGFGAYLDPASGGMGSLGHFESSFTGVNGKWKYVDGKMVYTALLPEMKKAIEFYTKAYQEKLLPPDFASLKLSQVRDMTKANKVGMFGEKAGALAEYHDELKKMIPDFNYLNLVPVTNINGYNPKGPGFAGMNAIPKKVPEAKMKRILKMIDTWMKPEVFDIQQYGIEGVHHTVKDGKKVVNTEKMTADSVGDFNQIVYVADPYASSTKNFFPKDANDLYQKVQDERAKSSVADIAFGLFSPTAQKLLPELEKKATDLKTKIILGREPITAWDTFVEGLKKDPELAKMSQELTEAYQKRTGAK